jgi:peptide subunit release factor 1 (eRF1)
VVLTAADGAVAECEVPFPPLTGSLVDHAGADRRVGVLLVRLGGYAAGVFEGRQLVASKVGSRQVHGRSAAGGQSQQRFARRREGQVRVALGAAADNVVRILVPEAARLDAVVLGGDRTAVDEVLTDRRLEPLLPLISGRLLDVPDPRLTVLKDSPDLFRAVRIRLLEPA